MELLTVIAIIGIMVSVVMGISTLVKRKSLVARTQANLEQLALQLDEYQLLNGVYPVNLEVIEDDLPSNIKLQDSWERAYIYATNGSRAYSLYSEGPLSDEPEDNIYPGK